MGEEDDPVVADELVEVDGTFGSVGLEVWSSAAQAQAAFQSVQAHSRWGRGCRIPTAGAGATYI